MTFINQSSKCGSGVLPQDSSHKVCQDYEWENLCKLKNYICRHNRLCQQQREVIIYLSMPKVSERFNQKDVIASIEPMKVVSDIYASISGELFKVYTDI